MPDLEADPPDRFPEDSGGDLFRGTNEPAYVTRPQGRPGNATRWPIFAAPSTAPTRISQLTGVAFLIVCDMLLTGFDAPIEQVMYIDKKIQEHSLLQAIARVNRVATGKSNGASWWITLAWPII